MNHNSEPKEHDFYFKIWITGNDKSGITSLLARYVDDTFSPEYIPTVYYKKKEKISQILIYFSNYRKVIHPR